MSVLIKGIEMPKNCILCPLNDTAGCGITEKIMTTKEMREGRADDCPLVEVPTPHGKLADCDAVEECLHEVTDCDDKIYALGLLSWAANKRTVIEAEVEE